MARPESTESSPQLRTLQPGADAAIERTIKDRLSRAAGDLNQVDYGALGENARAQYDTAKRFIQQANDAVRVKNYIFAESLADKAAVLASILLGR